MASDFSASWADPANTHDQLSIPAVTRQTHRWVPQDEAYYSRAQARRQRGEYESSIPTVVKDWMPAATGELLADVEDATRALVDFDTYALRVLGADNPALGPMSAILLRTESASSSQIEDLTTSAKQLALAELAESTKANALTVVGNVRAMEAAVYLSNRVDQQTILAMHAELLLHQPGYEQHAGHLRDQLVWIGGEAAGPRGAIYVAPQADAVPSAMTDLVAFAARDDLPVLLQVAVAHAQFETIHPFVDGNGRTGRALAQAMLRQKGLVSHATVPLSAGLLTDLDAYFAALQSYRTGDAASVVLQFAAAARFAAATGRDLVDQLDGELAESRQRLAGVRSHSAVWSVLPALVGQPIVTPRYLSDKLGLNPVTAHRALDVLRERGVLVERSGRRRNRVWEHAGILDALDEYADRIRRSRR